MQKLSWMTLICCKCKRSISVALKLLGEKGIKHFEEYYERRALMVKHDATSFMALVWCTSYENAFLWIGGCRPSLSIRLVYSVCGSELDAQLTEFLQGERKGNLAEISAQQMDMINALHIKTIKEEEKMSNRMAILQEEIADDPLSLIAKNSGEVGEWSEDLDRAMNAHSLSLAGILVDADRLRLSTLKDLMVILRVLIFLSTCIFCTCLVKIRKTKPWRFEFSSKLALSFCEDFPPAFLGWFSFWQCWCFFLCTFSSNYVVMLRIGL